MTIAAGSELGPYEITGAIGAVRMGEVYRARDSKLGRDATKKPRRFVPDGNNIRLRLLVLFLFQEGSFAQLRECFLKLLLRIHYDGTVPGHRLL